MADDGGDGVRDGNGVNSGGGVGVGVGGARQGHPSLTWCLSQTRLVSQRLLVDHTQELKNAFFEVLLRSAVQDIRQRLLPQATRVLCRDAPVW